MFFWGCPCFAFFMWADRKKIEIFDKICYNNASYSFRPVSGGVSTGSFNRFSQYGTTLLYNPTARASLRLELYTAKSSIEGELISTDTGIFDFGYNKLPLYSGYSDDEDIPSIPTRKEIENGCFTDADFNNFVYLFKLEIQD